MKRFSLFALCAVFACAPTRTALDVAPTRADSANVASSHIRVTNDQFSSSIEVTSAAQHPPGEQDVRTILRSLVGRSDGKVTHQLYVADNHAGEWKFWDRVRGEDAQLLVFTPILRKVAWCRGDLCRLNEHFGAVLPDSLLRAHAHGYTVKFYAQTGVSMIVPLSAEVIAAQLAAVDSILAVRHP